ncbi:MAG: hypothetical protein GY820_09800 [Gammaproteobacteria bacterium]|nr:hypothetical protein [Gammaproteobacteria bacterium]
MKIQLLLSISICSLIGCAIETDPSTWEAGQVLSERKMNRGKGFHELHKEVVNPEGHWEGIGHFSYLYFKGELLCQCTIGELVFSPDRKFALYLGDENGELSLLNTSTSLVRELSKEYIGYPYDADWNIDQNLVTAHLRKWNEELKSHDKFKYKFEIQNGT